MADEEVRGNKKVVLKNYVMAPPKESDMDVVTTGTVQLRATENSTAMVLKNLYLSCDPYMRDCMTKHDEPSYIPDFVLGENSEERLRSLALKQAWGSFGGYNGRSNNEIYIIKPSNTSYVSSKMEKRDNTAASRPVEPEICKSGTDELEAVAEVARES